MLVECSHRLVETPRTMQVSGMFDLASHHSASRQWKVELPLDEKPWSIGLVVGPSGSGKTTVISRLWPSETLRKGFPWPANNSILDAFPEKMAIKDIVLLLSSVGFSSPPSWLLPFECLSTGEQFRVTLARLLAEMPKLAIMDEFTSVVDRTVAQVGSAALAKTVRARKQRFVAATCHEDVEEWLNPDWVFRPDSCTFSWRCLRPRPQIICQTVRALRAGWSIFQRHHYLSHDLATSAVCFIAYWRKRPVGWTAWITNPQKGKVMREHRTVVLPDYQGVGIGHALSSHVASMWKGLGYRAISTTTHPAFVAARFSDTNWLMLRQPSLAPGRFIWRRSITRLTSSFEYVGEAMSKSVALALLAS